MVNVSAESMLLMIEKLPLINTLKMHESADALIFKIVSLANIIRLLRANLGIHKFLISMKPDLTFVTQLKEIHHAQPSPSGQLRNTML